MGVLYSSYVHPIDWTPTRSALRDPQELAKSLGITYDAQTLEDRFNAATQAQYDAQRQEYANTEQDYYRNMYDAQNSSLDAIRKSNASAVATGASKGLQAANELSSILGLQETANEGATSLAEQRNQLYADEQAAYKQNAVDALNTANEMGLSLGNLNANLYATDTQFDIGQMDYYAQLDAAMKSLMGTQEQANATMYNADRNLEGTKYSADKSYAAALASARSYGGSSGYSGSSRYGSSSYGSSGTSGTSLSDALSTCVKNGDQTTYMAMLTANGMTGDQALAQWQHDNSAYIKKLAGLDTSPRNTGSSTVLMHGNNNALPVYAVEGSGYGGLAGEYNNGWKYYDLRP